MFVLVSKMRKESVCALQLIVHAWLSCMLSRAPFDIPFIRPYLRSPSDYSYYVVPIPSFCRFPRQM